MNCVFMGVGGEVFRARHRGHLRSRLPHRNSEPVPVVFGRVERLERLDKPPTRLRYLAVEEHPEGFQDELATLATRCGIAADLDRARFELGWGAIVRTESAFRAQPF